MALRSAKSFAKLEIVSKGEIDAFGEVSNRCFPSFMARVALSMNLPGTAFLLDLL